MSKVFVRAIPGQNESEPELQCRVAGQGSALIVMVHGWCCSSRDWASQQETLANSWRVLAVDLRAHGASGGKAVQISSENLTRDVLRCIEAEDTQSGVALPVVLVGHSMGAYLCALALASLGTRVRGLIAVESLWQPTSSLTRKEIERLLEAWRNDPVSKARRFLMSMFPNAISHTLRDKVLGDVLELDPEVLVQTMAAALNARAQSVSALQRAQIPVFAINADGWQVTDLDGAREIGMQVDLIEGVGHFPMLEVPDRVSELLVAVIQRLTTI